MEKALVMLHKYLLKAGLKEYEADVLISRFLEEEAEDYVKTIQSLRDSLDEKEIDALYKKVKEADKNSFS